MFLYFNGLCKRIYANVTCFPVMLIELTLPKLYSVKITVNLRAPRFPAKYCMLQLHLPLLKWFINMYICIDFFTHATYAVNTECPNKNETGTNMPISLKLDRHLNNFGYYLLEGYLFFPTVPRNVGSITSVNEHGHLNKRLTIWLSTKSFKFNCFLLC